MWQNDVSAAIVCVAINAFPKLSDVLHGAVAQGGHGSEEHVRQIFGSHGGERFGEKDNTEEIKHLCAWLSAHKIPAPRPPLMSRTIRELLDSFAQGSFSMAEMELAADTARDMETAMRERWLADAQAQKTIPAILMVQGPVPVSTFDKITSIDFDDCTHLQAKIEQRKLGELANKQREQISRLSESIDPAQVAQSLQALREWLGSRQRTLVQAAGAAVPLLGMDQLQQSLEANAQVWTQILHRLAAQRSSADRQRQMAERKRRYVLRAFLVHRRTEAGEEKYSVVRRFGDGGASHFSILDAGKCRPIRLQSIEGSAVESMWVCCSDEPGSEENTVVADPDDEIFCRLCGYGESYSYNQIVLCDGCDAGVHQMCHDPVVMEEELVSSQWFCSTCRRRRQQQTAAKRVRTK